MRRRVDRRRVMTRRVVSRQQSTRIASPEYNQDTPTPSCTELRPYRGRAAPRLRKTRAMDAEADCLAKTSVGGKFGHRTRWLIEGQVLRTYNTANTYIHCHCYATLPLPYIHTLYIAIAIAIAIHCITYCHVDITPLLPLPWRTQKACMNA
jgi:hypothetical protein